MNFENAIRGMRNPLNSWDKSDSYQHDFLFEEDFDQAKKDGCIGQECIYDNNWVKNHGCTFILGKNDLKLARKLVKAGGDHRKFIRQIFVSVDILAPLYWWKEMDQYKVGITTNSCSTMHKIHAKAFSRDDFSHDHMSDVALSCLDMTISCLEERRQKFVETKCIGFWHDMIQLLPSSYNQLRTVTMNYENLMNIYYARRFHKLDEWHVVCDWIESLPYFPEICLGGESNE
jgi:hypothetical protein